MSRTEILELETYFEIKENDVPKYKVALVNQIKAAGYTHDVIRELSAQGLLDDSLNAVKETDIFRLRRGLCLPSAAASCINWVEKRRVVGDEDGRIRVGDIYRILLPYHGKRDFDNPLINALPNGWAFATEQGDVYHHSINAFSEALGVFSSAVAGFDSLGVFRKLIKEGGSVAVSLDNHFVIDQTLGKSDKFVKRVGNEDYILIDGPDGESFSQFENGRHVVSLVDFPDETSVVLIDSFCLPQMSEENMILRIELSEADRYLNYASGENARGIVFAKGRETLRSCKDYEKSVQIPDGVVEEIGEKLFV